MSNLFHYFSSFDKLMKEKLVAPLFWLLVIFVGVNALSEVFDSIGLDILDHILDFLNIFFGFLVAFVGIRVLCELAVAIFRINDNLSPDRGASETADIDPVAEARRAAEDAARRARLAADQAMERTQSATRRAVDATKATVSTATAKTAEAMDDLGDRVEDATESVKARVRKDEAVKASTDGDVPPIATLRPAGKPSTKSAASATTSAPRKRGRPKGSKTEVQIDPVTGERLKKDGTPYKKPGPKPKPKSGTAKSASAKSTSTKSASTKAKAATAKTASAPRKRGRPKGTKTVYQYDEQGRRLKKDGTLAKKPGPKST